LDTVVRVPPELPPATGLTRYPAARRAFSPPLHDQPLSPPFENFVFSLFPLSSPDFLPSTCPLKKGHRVLMLAPHNIVSSIFLLFFFFFGDDRQLYFFFLDTFSSLQRVLGQLYDPGWWVPQPCAPHPPLFALSSLVGCPRYRHASLRIPRDLDNFRFLWADVFSNSLAHSRHQIFISLLPGLKAVAVLLTRLYPLARDELLFQRIAGQRLLPISSGFSGPFSFSKVAVFVPPPQHSNPPPWPYFSVF